MERIKIINRDVCLHDLKALEMIGLF